MRADPIAIALLTIVLAILAVSRAAVAQPAGTLAGSLFDQTGGALVNVALDVRGLVVREQQSDATGRFEFRDVPPGDYELEAALAGFESIHRAIRIESGKTISLSLTMIVASLEQTVVTAAKTGTTAVQSSPLAISAISSNALSRFAIRTIDEAAAQTPLVTFTQNTTFGQLSIRGIGTSAVFAGADPSSAMYLDGVYLARPAMAFTDFLDVERLEVVRGPQGTLYGRNALGGAVNLITKAPSNDFEALARLTIGNLAERRAEARLSGALKRDRVMGSLAFARGLRDGYVRDLNHRDQRTQRRSRPSSTHPSMARSSGTSRTACWEPEPNSVRATAGGPSTCTHGTSRTRTTSPGRSALRRWRSAAGRVRLAKPAFS